MSIGPLDLSDADLSGFEAVDAGRYNAEIVEITMDAVKNTSGTGKMPAGTPIIKTQYRLTDEGVTNRRVWSQYVVPPADYDKSKAEKMKGMIVRFFMALGVPEEQIRNGSFDPDYEDFKGVPCVVVVGKEPKRDASGNVVEGEYNNPVKGVKPAGSIVSAGASDSGLL
ncbi:MAG TPA: DUF669 domain-containing protein [Nitrososphaera sp.]|jgi:hypothetical protein